ncbi:hypothetical protein LguiB_006490 [Lonicera macranthoides]
MDATREDLLDYMKSLNQYHLQFDSFGAAYDFTKSADARLLVFACDYPKWKLFMPLCVAALERGIPIFFFKRGADLARVCRTTKNYVGLITILRTFDPPFKSLIDQVRLMSVKELIPRKGHLRDGFSKIHMRYSRP